MNGEVNIEILESYDRTSLGSTKKVVCINDEPNPLLLKVGDIYEVRYEDKWVYVLLLGENGSHKDFSKIYFVELSEYRNKIIDNILNV